MKPDPEQFLQTLSDSGILSPEDISTLTAKLTNGGNPTTPETLADDMVRQGKLTKYQSREALEGKVEGLVLGQYTLLEEIGRGGMGVVYKARHRKMKRIVALKVLPQSATSTEARVQRFYREIEAVARLDHPNIVGAFDADERDGTHYLAMAYVEGVDLSAYVKGRGGLPLAEAVDYVLQAARGLAYAHDHGIVHRDVKPANLLLSTEGSVKLLDLGLAKLAEDEDQQTLTTSGAMMGTAAFMAPEQAQDAKTADHRADIYSLGCVFYRLLTGELPYKGDTALNMALAHREKPIPSLATKCPDLPNEVQNIYVGMMAKKVEDRYQSMDQAVEGLEKLIEGGVVPALDVKATRGKSRLGDSGVTSTPATRPRRKAVLIGSGIVAMIGLAMVVRALSPTGPPTPNPPQQKQPALDIARLEALQRQVLGHERAGRLDRAASLRHEMVQIQREVLGEQDLDYAQNLNRLGVLYQRMEDAVKAEPFHLQAMEIRKEVLGEEHPDYARSMNDLGQVYRRMGDYPKAESLLLQAKGIRKRVLGEQDLDYAQSLNDLGLLYEGMGNAVKAEPFYLQAMEIRKEMLGEEHPDYIWNLNRLAQLSQLSPSTTNLTHHGLVAHWTFDDGSGTTAKDSSGNGLHGTLKNMDESAWVTPESDSLPSVERNKGALRFNGNDDGVHIPRIIESPNFSIAMWIRPDGHLGKRQALIQNDGWSKGGVHFNIQDTRRLGLAIRMPVDRNQPSISHNLWLEARSKSILGNSSLGRWHHAVVSFSTLKKELRFYINGVLDERLFVESVEATPHLGPGHIGNWDALERKRIAEKRGFRGLLDDIRIYDRVLSEAEIKALAAGKK